MGARQPVKKKLGKRYFIPSLKLNLQNMSMLFLDPCIITPPEATLKKKRKRVN